jgi:hypothetical protein
LPFFSPMCRYIVDLGIKFRPLTNEPNINFIGDLVNWKADLYDRKLGIPGLRWCSLKDRFGPKAAPTQRPPLILCPWPRRAPRHMKHAKESGSSSYVSLARVIHQPNPLKKSPVDQYEPI